jgi:hypothetical protein
MKKFAVLAVVVVLLISAAGSKFWQMADENAILEIVHAGKDVVWVPTPQLLVDAMLDMAQVAVSDYVIDLGSGDGCIVISAAKRGATALGIEYNPDLVELAKRAATAAGMEANARFEKADIFEYDFSKASVLTLFLLPELNLKLRPKILDMKPGTRIVSNTFNMGDWEPDQTISLTDHASDYTAAHLWIVPAKVNGPWKFDDGAISFTQKFQEITGILTMGKQEMKFTGKLDGNKISFNAGGTEYTGTVSGDTISGAHSAGGSWKTTR